MAITTQQIEHIAKLARLGITEQEKEKYAKELANILDYFKKLEQADTTDILPIKQITGLKNRTRDDIIDSFSAQEAILDNALARKNRFVKVRSIL